MSRWWNWRDEKDQDVCTGLAGLVNTIEVDRSGNVIKVAHLVPLRVNRNRSYLLTSPKAEEDSNNRKNRTQHWLLHIQAVMGMLALSYFIVVKRKGSLGLPHSKCLSQPGLHLNHQIRYTTISIDLDLFFFFLPAIFTYHPHQHAGYLTQ